MNETAKFVLMFYKFFDIFNISNFTSSHHQRKPFKAPFRKGDDYRLTVSKMSKRFDKDIIFPQKIFLCIWMNGTALDVCKHGIYRIPVFLQKTDLDGFTKKQCVVYCPLFIRFSLQSMVTFSSPRLTLFPASLTRIPVFYWNVNDALLYSDSWSQKT